MRILTYKRTHIGDPDADGNFGINDCMGRARNWDFDAVIGVGGYGEEPRSYGIDGRVNWVGLSPTRRLHPQGYGQIVNFEFFVLWEEKGPLLKDVAPNLAHRMEINRPRHLLTSYSQNEQAEAEAIVNIVKKKNYRRDYSEFFTTSMSQCSSRRNIRSQCSSSSLKNRCSTALPSAPGKRSRLGSTKRC